MILRLPANEGIELITGQDGETSAFTARLKVDGIDTLSSATSSSHERAIFVLDTSLSSQPTRFAINRQLLAEILAQNNEITESQSSALISALSGSPRALYPTGLLNVKQRCLRSIKFYSRAPLDLMRSPMRSETRTGSTIKLTSSC